MTDEEQVGVVLGMTAPEIAIILSTLRWQAQGEPAEDSNGFAVTVPSILAGQDADRIEQQLTEGWEDATIGDPPTPAYHFIAFDTQPDAPMTRWLRFLIDEVYDDEVGAD